MYFQPVLTKCKSPKNRPDQTRPDLQLSKNVTTPYEIATCSYDPYTKLNDENYIEFF